MNFQFCSRCCNMTPHTLRDVSQYECDYCNPPNRQGPIAVSQQEAKVRVGLKRQLRRLDVPFHPEASTGDLQKLLSKTERR